ncbi:MAG: PTS sugar transporter subunit IIA [Verrucomicrobiales bacterium]|nr:PTS sugar transporter subunit IIA [Verrucomicrobiales bacterium]
MIIIALTTADGIFKQMTLAGLLSPNRVVAEMVSQEHWPAIVELVDHLVAEDALPTESREAVLTALKEREDQRSTGIGNGVAIPHCFSEDIDKVAMIFGKSTEGIEFCSLDRAPVHFVVLFVVPQSQYTLHLKTLAAIAKILNSAETRENLSKANDPEAILEVLSRKTARV